MRNFIKRNLERKASVSFYVMNDRKGNTRKIAGRIMVEKELSAFYLDELSNIFSNKILVRKFSLWHDINIKCVKAVI